jgi:hypothetical protein
MGFTIIKEQPKQYFEVRFIAAFMKYSFFVNARKNMRNTPKVCFNCNHHLKDEETIYLGIMNRGKNRIFCESCGKNIESQIGKE